ncbi:S9 family peptidase [Mesorhizobium sp. M4B.F.Ca.ET.215.01.1.1]|uniref:prolyl oligopeptidase family serine peptidase n=1 Tax=unclassified Mesorhizobium TaxID=325217 RepID=UPI000FD224E3|nr:MULTISPECIES: prolyl oligopeptidase family serine peptidase [unclassified Mesorhizobium]RUW26273.1 S9 family peptidase [Mesorhizobium sp. M4B.F.Ca.ET.013.02.1.1]RWF62193.1 MAG: S9 family peptidase [Mesorhizobium sp.]TGQ05142.1 S9 family peptidase [Mesorhizobium sp. M4B.F.Ca.ET.215.01.1.1]TGQ33623.1 S9 family peptidase [Mesorhizobium sp. M4B.F.Ca.ET.214.01.1.1]TGQ60727.1 S9 family peptidase [Mesorhizobium sp. M4B.F.Ca.ET.211.01.1.1]
MTQTITKGQTEPAAEDSFLWLEDRNGKGALDWVHAQNELTVAELQGDPGYQASFETALDLMTAEDNIPIGTAINGHVYNFWQDKNNVLGLWRRTAVASYKTDKPEWETIVDFDVLSAKEGIKWVFSGASRLYPDFNRCLVSMSPDGGDASEMREFDIAAKSFVEGGFRAAASKSGFSWLDEDTVIVSAAFEEDDKTQSGYPRVVKLWKRGTRLEDATLIFETEKQDLAAGGGVEIDGDRRHLFLARTIDFFSSHSFLRLASGENRRIPLPDDVTDTAIFQGQLVFGVRSPWTAPDGTHCLPDGLYSVDFERWIDTNTLGRVETVLAPAHRVSIAGLARTERRLFINLMDNVRGKVVACDRTGEGWSLKPVGLPENGNVGTSHAEHFGASVSFSFTDFLTPSSIIWSDDDGETLRSVKAQPARFDASPFISEQFEARSSDGTMIPYFVVRRRDQGGPVPTLLYGYGGFEVPLLPGYAGVRGRLWLEKGNVYVQANIRGGGEFGPAWHQAALKGNRQKAFDDFAAVAADLVRRGITTAAQLGIQGGSNGGLLTGTSLIQHPELFGAVIIDVPLLDMLRYTELPPGASWIAEYGDPAKPEEAAWLAAYSPYQHVKAGAAYPPVLLMTSTADDRVHPGHARKMAARLQEAGHGRTLFFEETEGGHGGRGDRRPQAAQTAMRYVFLQRALAGTA